MKAFLIAMILAIQALAASSQPVEVSVHSQKRLEALVQNFHNSCHKLNSSFFSNFGAEVPNQEKFNDKTCQCAKVNLLTDSKLIEYLSGTQEQFRDRLMQSDDIPKYATLRWMQSYLKCISVELGSILEGYPANNSIAKTSSKIELPQHMALGGVPIGGEKVRLQKSHDFAQYQYTNDPTENLVADSLILLNKSTWKVDEQPVPITTEKAIDLATKELSKTGQPIKRSHLKIIKFTPLFADGAEDVWYYDVVFDAASRTPLDEKNGRLVLYKRAIVLMNGDVITPAKMDFEEIRVNRFQLCNYKKLGKTWSRVDCDKFPP